MVKASGSHSLAYFVLLPHYFLVFDETCRGTYIHTHKPFFPFSFSFVYSLHFLSHLPRRFCPHRFPPPTFIELKARGRTHMPLSTQTHKYSTLRPSHNPFLLATAISFYVWLFSCPSHLPPFPFSTPHPTNILFQSTHSPLHTRASHPAPAV